MSSFKDAYLTDMGAELLAKTISEGAQLEFVKMVIGDGAYEEEEKSKDALKRRTELKSQKQEFAFASVSSSGEGAIKLKALINNKNVTEGYRITEIGIIAKIKGDTTTAGELYSVAVAEEADYLPTESTPITYIQEYYTKMSNAESVTINIEAGEYALAEDMMEVRFPVYEESAELSALESGEQVETKWGKVSKAINSLIEHIVSKASTTAFGHVKLSDSSAVTDSTGLALPVTEKNASIEGTMAHDIATLNTDLNKFQSQTNFSFSIDGSIGSALLNLIECGEQFESMSGVLMTRAIICGSFSLSKYLTASTSEMYLGYLSNGFPTTNGVPFPVKALLATWDFSVTQECTVYLKGDGGLYLSVPQTLKSSTFSVIALNDTIWANFNR